MRTRNLMHSLRIFLAVAMCFATTACFAQTESDQAQAGPTDNPVVTDVSETQETAPEEAASNETPVQAAGKNRAEQRRLGRVWKTMEPVEGFETIDMFEAMDAGEIEVVMKPRSSSEANFIVRNNSDRHLAIEMPPAFAGVPVLKQIGGFGGRGGGGLGGGLGGGGNGGFGTGGGQGVGGGFGGGGLGGGGFGGGGFGGGGLGGGGRGGVFNIPPGRNGKVAVKTFCLEHGKPDPRPRMDYTIAPIETLSTDPTVTELCKMLANDEITQNVAQAAAWNVANELTWDFLLTMNRVERMGGYFERYFAPNELLMAQRVVAVAQERGQAAADSNSGETDGNEVPPYELERQQQANLDSKETTEADENQ